MSEVLFEISMSLDGYVTGPNDSTELGLGEGGEQLHEWIYNLEHWRSRHNMEGGVASQDDEILEETASTLGSVVMGRRMFDIAFDLWGPEPPFRTKVFIITHRAHEPIVMQNCTEYIFVTDGLEKAIALAKDAAGSKNVGVSGGADIANQLINAGLVNKVRIHLVPLFLGGGRRMFENMDTAVKLKRTRVLDSELVTHLMFEVSKEARNA